MVFFFLHYFLITVTAVIEMIIPFFVTSNVYYLYHEYFTALSLGLIVWELFFVIAM